MYGYLVNITSLKRCRQPCISSRCFSEPHHRQFRTNPIRSPLPIRLEMHFILHKKKLALWAGVICPVAGSFFNALLFGFESLFCLSMSGTRKYTQPRLFVGFDRRRLTSSTPLLLYCRMCHSVRGPRAGGLPHVFLQIPPCGRYPASRRRLCLKLRLLLPLPFGTSAP